MFAGKGSNIENLEAAIGGVLWKEVFLKTSQSSQENTCARASFFNKDSFIKKETLTLMFFFMMATLAFNELRTLFLENA